MTITVKNLRLKELLQVSMTQLVEKEVDNTIVRLSIIGQIQQVATREEFSKVRSALCPIVNYEYRRFENFLREVEEAYRFPYSKMPASLY
jgi:hypothetical protein